MKKRKRKILKIPILIFLVALLAIFTQYNNFEVSNKDKVEVSNMEKAIVTKVIDGDTIIVEGGRHVRLLGIDADEKGYPCYDEAKKRLEELVLNKEVYLERDIEDKDQYGRYLRYVFIEDNGTMENINLKMVKEGLVVARIYGKIKYKDEIIDAEKYAMKNRIGCKWNKSE
ncbi:MAG: thermonuclease family protein [Candidatus Altarchaeaceae archaeon]